ncbi:MAG TPA: PIN domain-containing protein [Blastocatellia bacterium]|nr:PIN domain-containing protein [Blastocatellia bacterium]
MSNRIFVDTLFVVALVNPRDQYHQRATELADRFENSPLLTTDAVLLEIGNALARNFKQQAVEIVEHFFDSEEVEIVRLTPRLFEQAFELFKEYEDKAWGLVDCVSFIAMQETGINQALTFDQHFKQAGFQALMADEDA